MFTEITEIEICRYVGQFDLIKQVANKTGRMIIDQKCFKMLI